MEAELLKIPFGNQVISVTCSDGYSTCKVFSGYLRLADENRHSTHEPCSLDVEKLISNRHHHPVRLTPGARAEKLASLCFCYIPLSFPFPLHAILSVMRVLRSHSDSYSVLRLQRPKQSTSIAIHFIKFEYARSRNHDFHMNCRQQWQAKAIAGIKYFT